MNFKDATKMRNRYAQLEVSEHDKVLCLKAFHFRFLSRQRKVVLGKHLSS